MTKKKAILIVTAVVVLMYIILIFGLPVMNKAIDEQMAELKEYRKEFDIEVPSNFDDVLVNKPGVYNLDVKPSDYLQLPWVSYFVPGVLWVILIIIIFINQEGVKNE